MRTLDDPNGERADRNIEHRAGRAGAAPVSARLEALIREEAQARDAPGPALRGRVLAGAARAGRRVRRRRWLAAAAAVAVLGGQWATGRVLEGLPARVAEIGRSDAAHGIVLPDAGTPAAAMLLPGGADSVEPWTNVATDRSPAAAASGDPAAFAFDAALIEKVEQLARAERARRQGCGESDASGCLADLPRALPDPRR